MRTANFARALILPLMLAPGLFLTESRVAVAADELDRITVTATGQASIKPDVAEVRAAVTGSAAMAADALRKFQDNRRRAVEAIKKLKLENLSIEGGGLSMTSIGANTNRMAQIFGGNQNAGTPGHITVTEHLVIRLCGIDHMKEGEPDRAVSSMIDTIKDAGLTLGSGGMQSQLVRFRSTKLEDTRAAAVQNAMQSARHKAAALAALSNAKIVRIVSSREVTAPSLAASTAKPLAGFKAMFGMSDSESSEDDADEAASNELKPIPVSVTIEVQFATTGGQ